MTVFAWPARVRSSSFSSRRRTPHSSASFAGFCSSSKPASPRLVDEVGAEQVALVPAGQLEDAAPDGEDARPLVADDEARAGRRVVVVHQLEEEAEAAVVARDGVVEKPSLPSMSIDRCLQFGQMKYGTRQVAG